MKTTHRILITTALLATLAAIWTDPWWAWALTALLLFLIAAGIGGQAAQQAEDNKPRHPITTDHDVDNYRAQHGRPQYGKKRGDNQ